MLREAKQLFDSKARRWSRWHLKKFLISGAPSILLAIEICLTLHKFTTSIFFASLFLFPKKSMTFNVCVDFFLEANIMTSWTIECAKIDGYNYFHVRWKW
jgi:hypothetical protein